MNARLSSAGAGGITETRHAVCSVQRCGVRFGQRVAIPGDGWINEQNQGWTAGLWLVPGFDQGSDGSWRMSKRVWTRISQRRPPAYRRPPGPDQRWSPDLERGRMLVRTFPAWIVCPACGTAQVLDVEALELGMPGLAEFHWR